MSWNVHFLYVKMFRNSIGLYKMVSSVCTEVEKKLITRLFCSEVWLNKINKPDRSIPKGIRLHYTP